VTLAPLQAVAGMAARRFVSNDFRASCRQIYTLAGLYKLNAVGTIACGKRLVSTLAPEMALKCERGF
jgi:hypothetical protein